MSGLIGRSSPILRPSLAQVRPLAKRITSRRAASATGPPKSSTPSLRAPLRASLRPGQRKVTRIAPISCKGGPDVNPVDGVAKVGTCTTSRRPLRIPGPLRQGQANGDPADPRGFDGRQDLPCGRKARGPSPHVATRRPHESGEENPDQQEHRPRDDVVPTSLTHCSLRCPSHEFLLLLPRDDRIAESPPRAGGS